ncbi:MAG TPA: ABC transporter permease [Solirubrobacterales bacterium]|nr:ABC transporter permease [Solirubrobacterales bacterium]
MSTQAIELPAPRPARRRNSALLRALRQRRTQIGVAVTLLVLAVALLGPFFAPYSPSAIVGIPAQGASADFPLGTDALGRDVLSRVLWGGRGLVWMAFLATALGVLVGAALGMLAGFSRSWLDDALMRTMDVVLAFPQIILVLLFVSMLGTKLWLVAVLIAVSWVPQVARVARGVTSEVVQREYIQAAEAIKTPARQILRREVLPNIVTPIAVEFGLRLTWSIALVAAISFLGFGIQPPNADWGLMISENREIITIQPLPMLVPAVCIALFAIGTNFVADGLARGVARTTGGEGR